MSSPFSHANAVDISPLKAKLSYGAARSVSGIFECEGGWVVFHKLFLQHYIHTEIEHGIRHNIKELKTRIYAYGCAGVLGHPSGSMPCGKRARRSIPPTKYPYACVYTCLCLGVCRWMPVCAYF